MSGKTKILRLAFRTLKCHILEGIGELNSLIFAQSDIYQKCQQIFFLQFIFIYILFSRQHKIIIIRGSGDMDISGPNSIK